MIKSLSFAIVQCYISFFGIISNYLLSFVIHFRNELLYFLEISFQNLKILWKLIISKNGKGHKYWINIEHRNILYQTKHKILIEIKLKNRGIYYIIQYLTIYMNLIKTFSQFFNFDYLVMIIPVWSVACIKYHISNIKSR